MTKSVVTAFIILATAVLVLPCTEKKVVYAGNSQETESGVLSETIVDQAPRWDTNANWKGACRNACKSQFNSHVGFSASYRRTRFAISFPSNLGDFTGGPHFLTTELALKNADDVAVFMDLEYLPVTTFGIFGRAGMNSPSSHTMLMEFTGALDRTVGPGSAANIVSPWDWEARQFQWWMVEGGLQLSLTDDYRVIVGVRTERCNLILTKPVTRTSVPLGGTAVTPIRLLQRGDATGELRGDPEMTAYIPYIGIGGTAGKSGSVSSKWRLIGTPYGWTNVKVPITINARSPVGSEITTSKYSLDTEQSMLVEADFETSFSFNSVLCTTFRATGGFFRCQGNGRMKTTVAASNLFGVVGGTFPYEYAQVNRSFYSFGLSMDIKF